MAQQVGAFVDAILQGLVIPHVQIHAGQKGFGGIQAHIGLAAGLDALGFPVGQVLLGFDEVFDDSVVHLPHRSTLGGGDVQVAAQHHTGVVTALHIRHGEEGDQVEVQHGPEEVVLTQQVVAQGRCTGFDGRNVGIGGIDHLIGNPPGVVDVLGGGVLRVHVGVGERVFGFTGNGHVVTAELCQLEIVADIVVAAFTAALTFVGNLVLKEGVDTVGGIDSRGGVGCQLGGGHGVRRIEIHVAGRQRQGSNYENKYLFHNSGHFLEFDVDTEHN